MNSMTQTMNYLKEYNATNETMKLQVLDKHPMFPVLTELYSTWSAFYDQESLESGQTEPDKAVIRSILTQTYDNMHSPVFEPGTPDPSLSMVALDGHLKLPLSHYHGSSSARWYRFDPPYLRNSNPTCIEN